MSESRKPNLRDGNTQHKWDTSVGAGAFAPDPGINTSNTLTNTLGCTNTLGQTANNAESMSSLASTITYNAREDSIRSGKSVTISLSESVPGGEGECHEKQSPAGWKNITAGGILSSAAVSGGGNGSNQQRQLGCIQENVGSYESRRRPQGARYGRDFYQTRTTSNAAANSQLLAVDYHPHAGDEKKTKNIKVSDINF